MRLAVLTGLPMREAYQDDEKISMCQQRKSATVPSSRRLRAMRPVTLGCAIPLFPEPSYSCRPMAQSTSSQEGSLPIASDFRWKRCSTFPGAAPAGRESGAKLESGRLLRVADRPRPTPRDPPFSSLGLLGDRLSGKWRVRLRALGNVRQARGRAPTTFSEHARGCARFGRPGV